MNPTVTMSKNHKKNLIAMLLFFPIAIFYMELLVRFNTVGAMTGAQFLYIFLLSACGGALLSGILSLIRNRIALRITAIAITLLLTILLGSQMIYFKIFRAYFSLDSVGMAGDAMTDFKSVMFEHIGRNLFPLFLLLLPFILLCVFIKRLTFYPAKAVPPILSYFCFTMMGLSFLLASFGITADRSDYGAFHYYKYPDNIETVKNFGVITATRLNLQKMLFGGHEEELGIVDDSVNNPFQPIDPSGTDPSGTDPVGTGDPSGTEAPGVTTEPGGTTEPPKPIVYEDNVLDIDFDALIANSSGTIQDLHEYFAAKTPTKQNEYTGMFEGKNLIFLTLEGFSGQVIDPEWTPLLYQMSTQGFVFNNYYCSNWGGSTSTGEYANLTGNFYNSTSCMTSMIANTYQPFVLGNQFKSIGYTTKAYHAWTYTYYGRDKSHPSLGYDYVGYNRGGVSGYNGLETYVDSEGNGMSFPWVPSDADTARITIDKYINEEPFHVYYMTISGHTNYNWGGNAMCKKHRQEINDFCEKKGWDLSEEVKAYYACQLEVELMLQELVARLDEAGKLDNTVFVMAADHYPYGLSDASLSELYDLPESGIHGNFDLYRNSLIIWSSSMKEPIIVDKPCSAIDILPTVSNLFGLKYDSRLLAGTDVLSTTDPIVIINCDQGGGSWHWITPYGSYNTASRKFTTAEGFSASDDEISAYVRQINAIVSAKRNATFKVIQNDYYSYVFDQD